MNFTETQRNADWMALNDDWMVTEMYLPFGQLNHDWKVTEMYLPFGQLNHDWKVNEMYLSFGQLNHDWKVTEWLLLVKLELNDFGVLESSFTQLHELYQNNFFEIDRLTKRNYSKLYKFTILQNFGTLKLWFTMKNYGTMDKTMVLWTKLWYYILRTMELRFTKKKVMVDYQKLRDFDL